MSKIRVLQIGKYYHPYRGGFEASLYTLVNELKDRLEFQILASHTRCKTVIERLKDLTIIRLASFGGLFSQPITPAIFLWMKRSRTDIVHLHLPNPLAMIAYLIISPRGKLVVSYHNDIIRQKIANIFLMPLLVKILDRADAIVVTSENLIDSSPILKRFRRKCRIIPHGIDTDKFRATPELLDKAKKIRAGAARPLILFVGRLVYYKGLEYLIKAMKYIDARLMIIGEGSRRYRLKLLAKVLGVGDKITWLADISDEELPAYYHACDLFVLPSCERSESFGLVILEAHASGKPVVSTDLPTGVTFTNLHQNTGLVVPPKDSQALAKAINTLLDSKELIARYGQNGRDRVVQEFMKENMALAFMALYDKLLHF